MYECIIFDVDGTLINTEKAIIGSLQRMLKVEFGKEFSEEELLFTLGIPGEKALSQLGITDIKKGMEGWAEHLKDFFMYIELFSGIEEVVKTLNEIGIRTGIVTSRIDEEIKNDLVLKKLIDYFSLVICADDTLKHKPEPEPLLKFLEITEANPSKAIYIGDTIYDFKCAQGAGVDFGLALWGAKSTEGIKAKYNFKNPNEILEILSSAQTI
ncbi:HAD family hydrolase [Paramaledivibacter caminithermalis]|uniref:Haloacid dehalogenase superfamily, subfamily IA, variant 1 with third motif having Dx(3-4)D or Dx(3-4)E n=1 Tax=Paramaledivibacter caminithermalis (strain DSM 15212 / CIP 107654 / DViRD3) TaxID=1121301 RepID=A0A1M6SMW6_PARC5|nr:HAD family hydrolase [Paramaledivibacter caminithermalis]SHK45990.1 haloacid dehalogenase superfamily, subfamily IA, variant 1 with third motif having Dx(3-4)D or Dx(3-4)E [Paramaledivibacter caminithermalis DSM 15212]